MGVQDVRQRRASRGLVVKSRELFSVSLISVGATKRSTMPTEETIKQLAKTITPVQRQQLKQTYQAMDSNIGANGMAVFAR